MEVGCIDGVSVQLEECWWLSGRWLMTISFCFWYPPKILFFFLSAYIRCESYFVSLSVSPNLIISYFFYSFFFGYFLCLFLSSIKIHFRLSSLSCLPSFLSFVLSFFLYHNTIPHTSCSFFPSFFLSGLIFSFCLFEYFFSTIQFPIFHVFSFF